MAKLVSVDDNEAPKQTTRQAKLAELAAQYDPTIGMSGLQRFRAGIGKGMADIYRGAKQLTGNMTPEEYDEIKQRDDALMKTSGGFWGNVVGQAAPFMVAPVSGIMPAIGLGAAQGALTPVGTGDSRAVNTAVGGIVAGGTQGLVNAVGRILSGPQRFSTPEQMRIAARARELGFDLTPGQITGNPNLKSIEAGFSDLPLTGGVERARSIANQRTMNTIAGRAAGVADPTDLGEMAVRNALDASGSEIGNIARGTPQVNLDNQFVNDLISVADDVANMPRALPGRTNAQRLINEYADAAQAPGFITGEQQQVARSVLRKASEAGMNDARSVPQARAQRGIQNALDEALYRSISSADQEALQAARAQYAVGKAIEKTKPVGGNVSGPKLFEQLRNAPTSEVRDAAEVTKAFKLDIPDSGTARRLRMAELLQNPWMLTGAAGGGAYGASEYGPGGAVGGTGLGILAGLLGPRAMQGAYYSAPIRAYLQQGLLGGHEVGNAITGRLGAAGVPLMNSILMEKQ